MQTFCLISGGRKHWWTIKITPEFLNSGKIADIHSAISSNFYNSANLDPHLHAGIEKGDFLYSLRHPLVLSATWLMSASQILSKGKTIYLNKRGGFYVEDRNISVLKEVESNTWPTDENEKTLYIDIKKWGGGKHFYLTNRKPYTGFIDPNIKYDSYDEAFEVAKTYTSHENIRYLEPENYFYPTTGD